jgi:hypothetical protein
VATLVRGVHGLPIRHEGVAVHGRQSLAHVDREDGEHVEAAEHARAPHAAARGDEPRALLAGELVLEAGARKPRPRLALQRRRLGVVERSGRRGEHDARGGAVETGAHVVAVDRVGADDAHRRRVAHVDLRDLRGRAVVEGRGRDALAAAARRLRRRCDLDRRAGVREHEDALAVEQHLRPVVAEVE